MFLSPFGSQSQNELPIFLSQILSGSKGRILPVHPQAGYNPSMKGLYIHIPFCAKKCHYCDFVIALAGTVSKHERFLDALSAEINHRASDFKGIKFDTLYLGGGTPSALDTRQTRRLFGMIAENFSFKKTAEKACEVNPGDVTEEKAALYLEAGICRISLGAQSFDDGTLKRINRAHTSGQIGDSFRILRKAGFKNISLDLILSLPGQTIGEVHDSLKKLLELGPKHVSLYELTVEERTVFGRLQKKGKLDLPKEESSLEMLMFARDFLKTNGFRHYELLNYAKPGFESRHNLLYWANEEYLGLGPGAFSYVRGRRFQYSATYESYLEKVERGDWMAHEEEVLSAEKKRVESFLLALRLTEGAQVERFKDLIPKMQTTLSRLVGQGLLSADHKSIQFTAKGQLFAETVFAELSLS